MSRFRSFFALHQRTIALAFLLALAVTLAAGIGFIFGRQANPAPIIIETRSQ
jgi:hypothetical protein